MVLCLIWALVSCEFTNTLTADENHWQLSGLTNENGLLSLKILEQGPLSLNSTTSSWLINKNGLSALLSLSVSRILNFAIFSILKKSIHQ